MGADDVLTDPSSLYETSQDLENIVFSDTDLVHTVRNALTSVQTGESDLYNQLVGTTFVKENKDYDTDAIAQLEVVLKALSGSVACLDVTHHQRLLTSIFAMSLWDHKPFVMDALVGLIISLAASSGKYLDPCLNMLIQNFITPRWVIERSSLLRVVNKKIDVISRVHEALLKISYLVPLAPSRMVSLLSQKMPTIYKKDQSVVIYVENLLKLENSLIGQVGGSVILMMVMERLRDLDLEIGWDDIPQQDESNRGIFDMEIEDTVDDDTMIQGDEVPVIASGGTVVSDLLDKLMVVFFEYLESCHGAGRLEQVFEMLFVSFENIILNTYKSKFPQFLMFYACSLDPESCGVKFANKLMEIYLTNNKSRLNRMSAVAYLASYLARAKFLPISLVATMLKRLIDECADYCRTCYNDTRPEVHQIFYSGCQAIMYVLCFRMKSILDVPRFRTHLIPLEKILMHKLNPLTVCLPSVVAEFLRQAKVGGLFVVSDAFIFDDLLESELSRAFGGRERLDTFFPFDPCMLKNSNSFISPNFIYWSMVRAAYEEDEYEDDDDDDAEIIVNGDEDEDSDEGEEGDIGYSMTKMSITPKHSFKDKMERDRLAKMPSRIRPSTSPESL